MHFYSQDGTTCLLIFICLGHGGGRSGRAGDWLNEKYIRYSDVYNHDVLSFLVCSLPVGSQPSPGFAPKLDLESESVLQFTSGFSSSAPASSFCFSVEEARYFPGPWSSRKGSSLSMSPSGLSMWTQWPASATYSNSAAGKYSRMPS